MHAWPDGAGEADGTDEGVSATRLAVDAGSAVLASVLAPSGLDEPLLVDNTDFEALEPELEET